MVLASTTRIITTYPSTATVLIGLGQSLNGVATSILTPVPPAVSKTWFQAKDRTTATAVSALASAMGAAAAFLLGPLTISMPKMNGTHPVLNETDVGEIKRQLNHLNLISFGFSVAFLVLCVIYFPAKPSSAPSTSAGTDRFKLKKGIMVLVRNPHMWLIGLIYALPLGFFGNWSSNLHLELDPLGITQGQAGWIGFYGSLSGVVAGIAVSRLADLFKRKMKIIIIVLYCLAAVDFTWFTLMCTSVVPRSKLTLYVAVILANVMVNSCSPLFMEMTCETAYPVGEGLSTGFLGMLINLGAASFLAIDQVFVTDTGWTNWALDGVYIVGVPLLVVFRAKYKRFDIDTNLRSETEIHIKESTDG